MRACKPTVCERALPGFVVGSRTQGSLSMASYSDWLRQDHVPSAVQLALLHRAGPRYERPIDLLASGQGFRGFKRN